MAPKMIFLDLETLSLDLDCEIFEAAFIEEDGTETVLWLPVDESKASEGALFVNRYYLRKDEGYRRHGVATAKEGAEKIAKITTGKTIAGNNVGPFDQVRLRALLRRHGLTPAWSYRCTDVVDHAAGALGLAHPWTSKSVGAALGIPEPKADDLHTALSDARWNKLVYEKALAIHAERQTKVQVSLAGILAKSNHGAPADSHLVLVTPEIVPDIAARWAGEIAAQCWPTPQPAGAK